jgi:hypothetical protein
MAIQKSKSRIRIKVINKRTRKVVSDYENTGSYGAFVHLPMPTKMGAPDNYVVEVEYLGEHQFKTPYAKRLAAQQKNEEAAKKRKVEQDEKALVLRRKRIMNQIELAFEKKGKDAVKFVTCDECDAPAKVLGLTHENPGGAVISPEQVTGALCESHNNKYYWPYKTAAVIDCSVLEFFYDGLKQIYINRAA